MSEFYTELELEVARPLIAEFGFLCTLLRAGAATGPAHNPQPGADTETPCYLVETGYSLTDRDTTLVLQGDKLGLISTELNGYVPAKTDRIRIGADDYQFVAIEPLSPGGQTLLYEFHARR